MKVYVVAAPPSIRGIYESWPECKEAIRGVADAVYQSVDSREKAEAILAGGIELPPGTYAFTDGNADGGVGVVMVDQGSDAIRSEKEISTSVMQVFAGADVSGLESPAAVSAALARMHNILAELAGLYQALRIAVPSSSLTVVHDYAGVGLWMEGAWKRKDPVVNAVIEACKTLVAERDLDVSYRHQRGHQSTHAGRDDFAFYNGRADELATKGGRQSE